ncbi:hypothetical protein [Thermococcus sp.]|uniref:hypothetical protein n=1 Tax=Thermococcus sp. TaxID=35749 RepID=UPI00261E0DA7|nr:hypothetical protein [Thermococcus sp.]
MIPPSPPPHIRSGWKDHKEPLDLKLVTKAIETVKVALPLFTAGLPIVKRGPGGEIHIDVPTMYMDFAIDRIHYDPYSKAPSPKGRPVKAWGVEINPQEVRQTIEVALKEAYVIEAAEFREPENAWVIPVAWNKLIIMYVKVSYDGRELIPDYGLTEEVRRYVI